MYHSEFLHSEEDRHDGGETHEISEMKERGTSWRDRGSRWWGFSARLRRENLPYLTKFIMRVTSLIGF